MRLHWPTTLSLLLVIVPALVAARSLFDAPTTGGNKHVRQLRPRQAFEYGNPGRTTDTRCGQVTINLGADLNANFGPLPNVPNPGPINQCLCYQGITEFVETNEITKAASNVIGTPQLVVHMESIFNDMGYTTQCLAPRHSSPSCKPDNSACNDPCPTGWNFCNGACQTAKCPITSARGFVNPDFRRRAQTCPYGQTKCGVENASDPSKRSFECLETKSNIESCGGCTIPLLIGGTPDGVDCTSIANAAGVSCSDGKCIIESCKKGFHPDPTKSACVSA